MDEHRDFKFCTLVGHVNISLWIDKQYAKWVWPWSCDLFKFNEIIRNGPRYNGRLIGNHVLPIKWHDCSWPCVRLRVTL